MPSHKVKCAECLGRHMLPTGKKCKYMLDDEDGARDRKSTDSEACVSYLTHYSFPVGASGVQQQILAQLQKVNNRLVTMVDEMAEVKRRTGHTQKISILSLAQKASSVNNSRDSDDSSDESLV